MQNAERRQQVFRSFEAKSLRSRSLLTQIADDLTAICGSTSFLVFHVFFFGAWIAINMSMISSIPPFDPYPFGFLTMVVSLEAIFLSIFVLVSQNRSSYITTLREEVHMRVNLIAEEEITKSLQLLSEIRQKIGIKTKDPELEKMLDQTDYSYIERSIVEQLERANKPLLHQLNKEIVKKPLDIVHDLAGSNGEEK